MACAVPNCVNLPQTKYAWIEPNEEQLKLLKQCVISKLKAGNGETFLVIGRGEEEDDGLSKDEMDKSVATIESICQAMDATVQLLRFRGRANRQEADLLIRTKVENSDFMEVRVAVVGNVDSGKSTLLGVLTHGILDDGRGTARQKLFRHKHEKESGRTSSVGNDILGFDLLGQVVNKPDRRGVIQNWADICLQSAKVITFIDLAGHEKYLKTTVFGLTGHLPDYCMLIIGANMGIVGMTKEHLGLALALCVPVYVVITKIDMCPPNVLAETVRLLSRLLKSPGCRKMPLFVHNEDDVLTAVVNFTTERICPIFQVSNVRGDNLDLLRTFLNLLNVRRIGTEEGLAEYQIDDLYTVPGAGTVVSGTMLNGKIHVNDNLIVGPDNVGNYRHVQIKSIHRKRMPVDSCSSGQTASFSVKRVKREDLRKGMVIVSPLLKPEAHREFEADVLVLHHPTTISVKYQAMVHVGSVRQTAAIVAMSVPHLRTGDRAIVRFRFICNPEYLRIGQRLVFREGRTKAVGTITNVFGCRTVKVEHGRGSQKKQHASEHGGDGVPPTDQLSAKKRRGTQKAPAKMVEDG